MGHVLRGPTEGPADSLLVQYSDTHDIEKRSRNIAISNYYYRIRTKKYDLMFVKRHTGLSDDSAFKQDQVQIEKLGK